MTGRLPFNKRDRTRWSQYGFGHRPLSEWGSGTLPAPWAAGDIVRVHEGDVTLERMRDLGPGFYVVSAVFSIDEGDAWYVRLTNGLGGSDRLHVADSFRSNFAEDIDYMAGVELVDCADPDGLALREQILKAGWGAVEVGCPICHGTGKRAEFGPLPPKVKRKR